MSLISERQVKQTTGTCTNHITHAPSTTSMACMLNYIEDKFIPIEYEKSQEPIHVGTDYSTVHRSPKNPNTIYIL